MARAARLDRRDPRATEHQREVPRLQPPVEQLLQLQRTAGNAAVARAVLARRFDRAAYERSMTEREAFVNQLWSKRKHRPSTGRGMFDVLFDPGPCRLTIVVPCKFWFQDGDPALWEGDEEAGPNAHLWNGAEIMQWKADFKRRVSNHWSGKHTFHCTRDWWEDLTATVRVRFIETEEEDAYYVLNVLKLPEMGDTRTSRVKPPPKKHGKPGAATLDSQDLDQFEGQTPAYHEGGHMLGLGDEYPGKKFKGKPVPHAKLVQAEFGKGTLRARDDRIMSGGDKVEPEHGVTFLEALRAATKMKQWSFTAKTPAPVLSEPVDGPPPKRRDPLAPEEPEVAFV